MPQSALAQATQSGAAQRRHSARPKIRRLLWQRAVLQLQGALTALLLLLQAAAAVMLLLLGYAVVDDDELLLLLLQLLRQQQAGPYDQQLLSTDATRLMPQCSKVMGCTSDQGLLDTATSVHIRER